MFTKLAKFEFNYFLKQPSFYVTSFVLFLLSFMAMTSENVQIGVGGSNINYNAPTAIAFTMILFSIIGMFLVANFVGGTATRDYAFKMDGIIHSAPVTKGNYLWGRLFGVTLFCLAVFAFVPLGTLIGSMMPWVDADRLGDTSLFPYFKTFIIFVVPNFIFCSALFYSFAMLARSMMGMYLGVVGFFILYNMSGLLLNDPSMLTLSALIEPFGIQAFSNVTRYWTPHEMNTQLVDFEGLILQNRVIWLSISALIIVLTHYFIDIRKLKKVKVKKEKKVKSKDFNKAILALTPVDTSHSQWSRFKMRTLFEIKQIIKSPGFIILAVLCVFQLSSVFFGSSGAFGSDNWPLTRTMAQVIQNSFALLILIILVFYSGEVVWRERQLGMGDIVESTPSNNWTLYFPKVLALFTVVFLLLAFGVAFTTLFQVSKGYLHFEFGVYFKVLALTYLIPTLMKVILAVFFQIISPNKYVGMGLFVIYILTGLVLFNLGFEHHLWHFSLAPRSIFSDMNQFGYFSQSLFFYDMYWLGLTIILVVLGYGLYSRGAEYGFKHRLSLLSKNLGKSGMTAVFVGVLMFVGMGSYIFYQTRVVNKFMTSDEQYDEQALYEKTYKQYEDSPITSITDVKLSVDIYPYQRKVTAKGYYIVKNKTNNPISKEIVYWDQASTTKIIADGTKLEEFNKDYKIGWLHFNPALKPGESKKILYEVSRQAKGFVDSGSDHSIVANGSFISNFTLLPHFGYNKDYEINDRQERKKRDLPPPQRMAKLENSSKYRTGIFGKEADFISYEATVSTTEDQFAITPGYLQKEWVEGDRRYFHYKMDVPIQNFFSFLSGKYEVKKETYKGKNIEIYYHKDHDKNIQRMIETVKTSLDVYNKEFSPYQYRQVRVIEFPRYAAFAQSFSNTIPYSEDIGFIADLRDKESIDVVAFVTAHEMGHQWWAHQVAAADVQGSTVLSESLAEYSAYLVLEKMYGIHQLRKFLKLEMDRYLRKRSGELLEENPLMRVESQGYIRYEKGGIVMYSLKDRLGAKKFNGALKRFLEDYQYASEPYPTTLDLVRYIKAIANPEDMKFIDDVLAKITLFDLKTKKATAKKLANGNYQVELIIEADKYYADGKGEETKDVVEDYFDIGIFSDDPDTAKGDKHVLKFDKEFIKTGKNILSFEVKELPKYAGVDPYIKMIDRNSDDNMVAVEILKE